MAGLVYGFGLFFVVWLSWPLSSVWAWLPWLLLCVWLVVRRPGPRPVAALALVVALQFFGGHPESSFHVLAAGSFFALLALSRIERGARLRAIGRLAAGLVAGSLLAAVALLPFLELLRALGRLREPRGQDRRALPGHRADQLRAARVLGPPVAGADAGVRVLARLLRGRAAADARAVGGGLRPAVTRERVAIAAGRRRGDR